MNGWLTYLRSKQPPFDVNQRSPLGTRRRKSFRRWSRNLQFQQDVRLQLRSHGSEDRTCRDSKLLSRGVSFKVKIFGYQSYNRSLNPPTPPPKKKNNNVSELRRNSTLGLNQNVYRKRMKPVFVFVFFLPPQNRP